MSFLPRGAHSTIIAEEPKIAQNLRDLSVAPIIIQVRNKMSSEGGFNAAWERLIGKLFLRVQNVYVYHDSLQNLPLGKSPNIRSRRRNVSISLSSDLRYPEWCVMRIPYEKLRAKKLRGKYWLFYCGILGKVYFWRILVEKLLNLAPAQEQEEENKRFVVLLGLQNRLTISFADAAGMRDLH